MLEGLRSGERLGAVAAAALAAAAVLLAAGTGSAVGASDAPSGTGSAFGASDAAWGTAPAVAASDAASCPSAPAPAPYAHAHPPLVPGHPVAVRLCQYGTAPTAASPMPATPANALTGSASIGDVATVRTVTRLVDRLPVLHGVHSCPADLGLVTVATFRYATGRTLDVVVGRTGCRIVSRGGIHRTALLPPGDRLLALLSRLVA